MRFILKTKTRLISLYWVNIQPDLIVGGSSANYLKDELKIHENVDFELHSTYPKDGNYHVSYKLIADELEQFISVYWDRVKVKTIKKGNIIERVISEITREECDHFCPIEEAFLPLPRQEIFDIYGPILTVLVPPVKQKSLLNASFFQPMSMHFNVYNGDVKKRSTDRIVTEDKISEEDLIVDVSNLTNVAVSIWATIKGEEKDYYFDNAIYSYSKVRKISDFKCLELMCNIFEIK